MLEQLKRKHMEKYARRANEYGRKYAEVEELMSRQEEARKRFALACKEETERFKLLKEREVESVMEDIREKNEKLEEKAKNKDFLITQIKEDGNTEREMMSEDHRTKLQRKNEKLVKIRGESQVNANKADECNRKGEELGRDIKELRETIRKVESEGNLLHNQIKGLSDMLTDRSKAISKLERDIYQHKNEAQKLEKFKFVLDYRIKELKHEMNPREREIESLRERTTQMDVKLKKFNKLNMFLGDRVKELQETQISLQRTITNNRERLRKNVIRNKECIDALDYCSRFINFPEKLKAAVLETLSQHKEETEQITDLPPILLNEFQTQEDFMAKSVKALGRELEETKKVRRENNRVARNQNKMLLREIQRLRGLLNDGRSASISGAVTVRSSIDLLKSKSELNEDMKTVDENRNTIRVMREKIQLLTRQNEELRSIKHIPI
eukprot:TRINITY_DN9010_c0_g1_i6.p1 TRINITY_DN9010_c0_g1~~TRINITY_DN9010_c0_g1_i6.p1  ORF type:complete len:441 (+),score=166.55 TRINITY_DN9010_c0_g1_i6:73-1395(+)